MRRRNRRRSFLWQLAVRCWLVVTIGDLVAAAGAVEPFAIEVVDAATGRGVPLVVLRTTNEQVFVTDSAGLVAIDAPDLLGRKVYFHVASHGYEFPKDGFGFRGTALDVVAGGYARLEIKRLNLAERLYRVTGGGIYADSLRLGRDVPLPQPLAAGGVMGQDSVQAAVFGGRIHWFWGDTNRLTYPLGQFRTSGATSRLPADNGLPPDRGVDLTYYTNDDGFSRPMFEVDGPGVVWLDGVGVVADDAGREHLIGHFSRRKGLAEQLSHGVAELDADAGRFKVLEELPQDQTAHPQGQAFRLTDTDGQEYLAFATPYPTWRVSATLDAVLDTTQYEAFTPLVAGSRSDASPPPIERDAEGRVVYAWKRNAVPLTPAEEHELVEQGLLAPSEARWQTTDAATGDRVLLHAGSVRWNAFRNRWVMIAVQHYGQPSFLGEVWYAEADQPTGPWTKAVRIMTHDKYSFYNPTQHAFFDEDGGRLIYFEGTYTHTFSGNPVPTPRYDYNQIMYRLDLSDPRLEAAH